MHPPFFIMYMDADKRGVRLPLIPRLNLETRLCCSYFPYLPCLHHPVHVHLVDFQVVSRTGGSRGILPYESAGLKDIVLLEPGETVDILAYYGPWNGLFMFHCHNLIHEDHMMMASFNVTALAGLGYDNSEGLDNPDDTRFVAQDWSADAYSDESIQGRISWLGSLGAYNQRTELVGAIASYYSTNPSAAVETGSGSQAASNTVPTQWSGNKAGNNNGWNNHGAAPTQTQGPQSWGQNWGGNHGRWGGNRGGH